jgi:hypothetical protein
MPSELQEERDNARDMIEEAYQSYRFASSLTLTLFPIHSGSVADPDPGFSIHFTPGSGIWDG